MTVAGVSVHLVFVVVAAAATHLWPYYLGLVKIQFLDRMEQWVVKQRNACNEEMNPKEENPSNFNSCSPGTDCPPAAATILVSAAKLGLTATAALALMFGAVEGTCNVGEDTDPRVYHGLLEGKHNICE